MLTITSQTASKSRMRRTRFHRCQTVASRRARTSPYIGSTLADIIAESLRQFLPTVPIVLGAAVFDRDNRETRAEFGIVIDQLFRRFLRAVGFLENVSVLVAVEKLR